MKLEFAVAAFACAVPLCAAVVAQPVAVTKTNPLPVYMHYMPWYETPATLGGSSWGYHSGRLHDKSCSEQDLFEVGLVPAGDQAFVFDADLGGALVL